MRASFLFALALTLSLSFQVAADEETVVKPNFDGLGNRICNRYNNEKLVGYAESVVFSHAEKFYNEPFVRYKDKTPSPEQTEELRKVVEMMNQNAGEIKCGGKHFIHYAFEMGKYQEVVSKLLFRVLADKDKGIHYDFNAVTMTDDPTTDELKLVPMTVLDYIDKVAMNTSSISGSETATIRINAIRKTMVKHFGALSYHDPRHPVQIEKKARLQ